MSPLLRSPTTVPHGGDHGTMTLHPGVSFDPLPGVVLFLILSSKSLKIRLSQGWAFSCVSSRRSNQLSYGPVWSTTYSC
jgi:hypothetical protein